MKINRLITPIVSTQCIHKDKKEKPLIERQLEAKFSDYLKQVKK